MEIKKVSPRERKPYKLGRICELTVLRLVSIGAYLDWDNEEGILLPLRYCPQELRVGDTISVFVYQDNQGRLIATTLRPHALVGEVARLRCVSVSSAGAFMDWGIHKDLFVPFAEQLGKMQEERYYMVYLYIDHISGKIVGSAKLNKHIGNTLPDYKPGAEVSALVVSRNEVGYRVVVEHQYWGILYHNTLSTEPLIGEALSAYVVRLREDGRLDLSPTPVGYVRTEGNTERILELLDKHNGRLPIGDKSPAQEIERLTGLSKKSFKMAIGRLYKERRIRLQAEQIELIN